EKYRAMSGEERLMLAFDLRESADVSAKLRMALSRYFQPALAARQPGPLLATRLRDSALGTVHASVRRISATPSANASPRVASVSYGAFIAGIVALACTCLVVPQHTHGAFGVWRMHEFLARLSAAFLAVGMLCGCWCALKNRRQSVFAARLFWTWSFVTLLPLVGVLSSECLLVLTRPKPSRALPIRNALRHSFFWHLGFGNRQTRQRFSCFFARRFF